MGWDSGIWGPEVSRSWGLGVSDNLGNLGKAEALTVKVAFWNRDNNGKLSMAQCRHLLYLPPHYSQQSGLIRIPTSPESPLSSSLGPPQSRHRSVPRRPGAGSRLWARVTPLSGGECVRLGRR